jgi:hypothetical protein
MKGKAGIWNGIMVGWIWGGPEGDPPPIVSTVAVIGAAIACVSALACWPPRLIAIAGAGVPTAIVAAVAPAAFTHSLIPSFNRRCCAAVDAAAAPRLPFLFAHSLAPSFNRCCWCCGCGCGCCCCCCHRSFVCIHPVLTSLLSVVPHHQHL